MARAPRRPDITVPVDGAEPDFTPIRPRPPSVGPAPAPEAEETAADDKQRALVELNLECPVCLQTCIHPVQLPCTHVFCYLCIKGVANHSKKCALCRHDIPVDYLNNPVLLDSGQLVTDLTRHHGGYQWYYEGRNGWWQYDERASRELEEKYASGTKIFELLIAGFLYIIDFDNLIQIRRNDPSRRRRMKRDLVTIDKKGVAGLKVAAPTVREGAYGAEGEKSNRPAAPPPSVPPPPVPSCEDTKEDDDLSERLQGLDLSTRSTDGAESTDE